jgi:MATE family multidrug resistance protein
MLGAGLALCLGLLIYFSANLIVVFYTNIEEVKKATVPVMQFLALFHQIDSMQGVASGVLRGIGKTTHASIGGAISYWIISLPMEYLLGIKYGYGVLGLWLG